MLCKVLMKVIREKSRVAPAGALVAEKQEPGSNIKLKGIIVMVEDERKLRGGGSEIDPIQKDVSWDDTLGDHGERPNGAGCSPCRINPHEVLSSFGWQSDGLWG